MRMTHAVVLACVFSVYCGGGGGGGGGPTDPLPNPPSPPGQQTVFHHQSPLGDFAVYLPPGVSTYRGAILMAPGATRDTRVIADTSLAYGIGGFPETTFQDYRTRVLTLAQEHGLAVMGARLPPNATALNALDNLLDAMVQVAAESQHPELATAPFLFDGGSAGGCFSYAFTRRYPERVIGFVTQKGGCHDIRDGGAARQVPGFLVIGGADTRDRCLNLTTLFENNRPLGALWALTVEPGAPHDRMTDFDLMLHWMDIVLESRLPAPGGPATLRPMSEESGWLGDRETAAVAQFSAYDKDKGLASWLPSAQAATGWSAFVSPGRPLTCPADPPPGGE